MENICVTEVYPSQTLLLCALTPAKLFPFTFFPNGREADTSNVCREPIRDRLRVRIGSVNLLDFY